MKIAVEDERILVSGRGGGAVRFTDISEIAAEKVGKVTYDEVFLIVRSQAGEVIILGELDEGFAQAEKALQARLKGFPEDWWDAAEQRPLGLRVLVWPASA